MPEAPIEEPRSPEEEPRDPNDNSRSASEEWLPPGLAERLQTIRDRVTLLYEELSSEPPLPHFTPHGVAHCQAVEDVIHRLLPPPHFTKLSPSERFFLLGAAWLHDVGMLRGIFEDEGVSFRSIRDQHHVRAERFIVDYNTRVGVEQAEAHAFAILVRFHRRRCRLIDCPVHLPVKCHGGIRLRLLAAYLRLADALDVDQTRTPPDQYAISLAYDIPTATKLHWLRSKFVLGIDPDSQRREIVVHFKYPLSEGPETIDDSTGAERRAEREMLNGIYDLVEQDLTAELDSVKETLFCHGLSWFLRVTRDVHPVVFDRQLQRDTRTVLSYFFLLDNPSSSALFKLLLESVKGILETHRASPERKSADASEEVRVSIEKLLVEVERGVLHSRRCHRGLAKLVEDIRAFNHCRRLEPEQFGNWIDAKLMEWAEKRRAVRRSAHRCFMHCRPRWASDEAPSRSADFHTARTRPINILLYGYSELVIKALCGFRDCFLTDLASDYAEQMDVGRLCSADPVEWSTWRNALAAPDGSEGWSRPLRPGLREPGLPFHKADLERQASDHFRVFVCEGQPKNRTRWQGLAFHDGTRYAQSLARCGFNHVFVVPDAIAGSLIAPFHVHEGAPTIDYVMVGANGFDETQFYHSAGHAAAIAIASFAKMRQVPSNPRPSLVLAITTDKYAPPLSDPRADDARPEEASLGTHAVPPGRGVTVEGWRFQGSFGREPVRLQVFFTQDGPTQSALRKHGDRVLFYNPREDHIDIDCVDILLTERCWLAKSCEPPASWCGKMIAARDSDSTIVPSENSNAKRA